MPELPDITAYIDALEPRVLGQPLERFRLGNPFVVRTIRPDPGDLIGLRVESLHRLGKRIVFAFESDRYLIVHLMIAGRFRWRERGAGLPGKIGLAAFDFPAGTLLFTEAGSRRQASIHIVEGAGAAASFDPGGLEVLTTDLQQFETRLTRDNHTLKRALTDPHIFSGIGNAYSDEILHAARLSPLKLTRALADEEVSRLHDATRATLLVWIDHLRREAGGGIPEKVTAFHDAMAVHGRFRQPCPVCGAPIQRIVYAENECNYCARCQTGGRVLADRSLSRLLKDDWPRELS